MDSKLDPISLILYSVQGKKMPISMQYRDGLLSVGTMDLKPGVYFVLLRSESKYVPKRFIKI
ncbi:MAG: T9SS type A sorting domain-containing protein [Saprospiraceae bacterium]|nr:T9SS type A sorting domain-containing protein [Saprospiraceae bacterium]